MLATTAGAVQEERRLFYVWMAAAFMAIAVIGFIPTFWAKIAIGAPVGRPILYFHGVIMFAWTLFVLLQTSLVAKGRITDHRAWGVAGVSLATVVVYTIVLVTISVMREGERKGFGEFAHRAAIVQLTNVTIFAGLIAAALLNVNRPEIHKRLMIVAMVPVADPAIARIFRVAFAPGGGGPSASSLSAPGVGSRLLALTAVPAYVADLLIVAAMVYDWRTRGRPHPVYIVGGAILLTNQLLYAPISATPAWMAFTRWVESLTS